MKISHVVVIPVILLLILASTVSPWWPAPGIKITHPTGGIIDYITNVEGTSIHIPEDSTIWIAILSDKYYLLNTPAQLHEFGRWSKTVDFSSEYVYHTDRPFTLVALLVNNEAKKTIAEDIGGWLKTRNYIGYVTLPKGAVPYDSTAVSLPHIEIEMTTPQPDVQVATLTYINGTSKNLTTLTNDYAIWVAIQKNNTYYPLRYHATLNANGKWSTPYSFLNEPLSAPIEIVVWLTDKPAQNMIEAYLKNCITGNCDGLQDLPKGVTPYDRVALQK